MTIIKQYNNNTAQWEAIAVGQKGDTGAGVANGGVTDAVLIKASNTDFDTTWSQDLNLTTLELTSTLTTADILPSVTNTYDLGSANNTWRDLYLSGNSIFLGNATITETTWDEVSTGVLPYDGTISGLTANTVKEAIDETVSLTDTAYSNAVAYADAVGNSAYSNAISYTDSAVANLIDTAPDALNTLNELAAALNDDPDFANTVVGQVTTAYTNATSYTDSSISALGLGTIATQNANNVNIDGGTIDGTAVNATTLTASGDVNFDSGTLFVDESTNRVGVGTTSPNFALDVQGALSAGTNSAGVPSALQAAYFQNSTMNSSFSAGVFSRYGNESQNRYMDVGMYGNGSSEFDGKITVNETGGSLILGTSGAERMRIDSSGNVGIGTTSPSAALDVRDAGTDAVINLQQITANYACRIAMQAVNANGSRYNGIVSGALDGTSDWAIGRVSNNVNNNFGIWTAGTERMRIDSSGNVGIGTTGAPTRLTVQALTARDVQLRVRNTAGNYGRIQFSNDANYYVGGGGYGADWSAGSGVHMNFTVNLGATPATATLSTAGVWTNASDIRYKENVVMISYGLAEVMQLKPSKYNMIGSDKKQIGLIAQDVLPIIPEVVESVYCEDLKEDRYTLSYGNLVTLCIKSIQELKAELDTVKAELQTLKGN